MTSYPYCTEVGRISVLVSAFSYYSCIQHFGKFHSWSDFRIQPIEQVHISDDLPTSEKEKKLLARERHWMAELRTIYFGLNDRNDIRLQLRRNFKE